MSDLESLLKSLQRGGVVTMPGADGADKPLPADKLPQVVDALKQLQDAYGKPCPYKVGDLVIPKPGISLKDSHHPSIVVEVFSEPLRGDTGKLKPGEGFAYPLFDMRVLTYRRLMMEGKERGTIVPYLVESWAYRKYDLPSKPLPTSESILEDAKLKN